jgi:hypothetical protein
VTVSGTGEDEAAALRDLDGRLRGVPKPDGGRLDELRRRLRFAYVDGAEDWTGQNIGRGMTRDELGRVIGRYVGRSGATGVYAHLGGRVTVLPLGRVKGDGN